MSAFRLLSTVVLVFLALPAPATTGNIAHPRTPAARNSTPSTHEHTVHAHVHAQRPHHSR